MKKQIIIRSAAIVIAGIAASTYAAQNFLNKPTPAPAGSSARVTAQPEQVLGAGLVSSGTQVKLEQRANGAKTPELPTDLAQGLTTGHSMAEADDRLAALQDEASPGTRRPGTDFAPEMARLEPGATETGESCTPQLTATAGVDALIELRLSAPCYPDERLVISHGDLAFSGYTSPDGHFSSYLPALAREAKIDVFLSDDQFLNAAVTVEGVEEHLRIILQWSGSADFSLHAYHDGADFGSDGHIHASRPFDPNHDAAFLISLGESQGPEPMLAEIYSIPAEHALRARVEVEMRYTELLCGRDMSAYLLQTGPGTDAKVREMTFSVPDCPTETGILVMPLTLEAPRHATLMHDSPTVAAQPRADHYR